jgi:hypothetical protein
VVRTRTRRKHLATPEEALKALVLVSEFVSDNAVLATDLHGGDPTYPDELNAALGTLNRYITFDCRR